MRKIPIPEKLSICESYLALTSELETFLSKNNTKKLFFIDGEFSRNNISKKLCEDLKLESIKAVEADYIVGTGGGKSLDQAKKLAKDLNKNFISIPTLISHDGICSPVAVIDGKSHGAVMPTALFVPLYLIENAQISQIQAGVGDLISNLSAIEDWKLAHAHGKAEMDDFAVMLSRRAAMNVVKSLENMKQEEELREKNFLKSLIESLALSGIAMSIAGNSRPCSGAEHMISHAIDEIYGAGNKASHGIQVLIASIYLERLRAYDLLDNANNPDSYNNPYAKLSGDSRLYTILKRLNFPLEFVDIGVNMLDQVLEHAPRTRADRYSILSSN
jgi:glycerol dehydrogenase-like iron-containing ADH family enzyme